MDKETISLSKFISLVLRHRPEVIGIELDPHGWCRVDELITKMNQRGKRITEAKLREIVAADEKQRYAYNHDCTRIRANQGHSINVELGFEKETPPEFLYHGTADKYVQSIMHNGLHKRSRQYVHLSSEKGTAEMVGKRRGNPVVLKVEAAVMHQNGYCFYRSENNVWLCDFVPKEYIMIDI